jgi:hypothetical protein
MKRICTVGVVITASLALLQSAEAGSRGASRSFSSGPHFSGPSFSSSAHHSAGPGRSFSSGPTRFNGTARFSSAAAYRNRSYAGNGPRFFPTATVRNPAYLSNRTRFSGDRTTAFNARTSSRSTAQLGAGRASGTRAQAFNNNNRERVVARHSANWRRNWDRSRDHWWNGRRCHFRNNVWVIYEPFFGFGYPYGYGYYPYGGYYDNGYYDNGYYDDSYASNEYSPAVDTNQPQYDTGSDAGSRLSDVQSALAREGYYDGTIDGRLGNATRRALRNFQRDHRLKVTGAVDGAVIEALRLR